MCGAMCALIGRDRAQKCRSYGGERSKDIYRPIGYGGRLVRPAAATVVQEARLRTEVILSD